jgi:hypothetical protein
MKTVGVFRRTRYRGEARTALAAYLVGAAYSLVRIANLDRAVSPSHRLTARAGPAVTPTAATGAP